MVKYKHGKYARNAVRNVKRPRLNEALKYQKLEKEGYPKSQLENFVP